MALSTSSRTRGMRRALTLTAAAGLMAAWVPSASAATTATVPCTARTSAQKFLKVDGDTNAYFTAPSGTFESGTSGWTLGNSSVVTGNEPLYVNGSGQAKSLRINSGVTAISPNFCIQQGEPSLRFFYKGTPGAVIHLHIDVTTSTSNLVSPLDWQMTVPANGSWVAANGLMTPYLNYAGNQNMQLKFTASNGSVQIDDVEVDPWKSI